MCYELLVPIDPDDPEIAAQTLEIARGLAQVHNVALTVLSVGPGDAPHGNAPDDKAGAGEPGSGARDRLEVMLAQSGGLGEIRGIIEVGDPLFRALRSAARTLGVDLLMLGSRDPDFSRRLVGAEAAETVRFGDLTIDRTGRRAFRRGREVHLGPTEFRLLDCLLGKPGRPFSREELIGIIWGADSDVDARTVDVYVARLRKALNHSDEADPIRTVRAVGYEWDLKFDG